jgi:SAM-dependent methyltransferase
MTEVLVDRTRAHYDAHPFIQGGANRVRWWRDYLREFLPDDEIRDRLVVDVGSSVGEISRGLLDRGARVVCLDLSLQSLRVCRAQNPEAEVLHGNALNLPFADGSFDHAISIGVLHHTPDCRRGFDELARVTAPGGLVVVFLYNFWNVYNVIYHVFRPVRAVLPLERVPRWAVRLLQPFVRSHLQQKLDDTQLRNLLGDKLWTPRATFHTVAEVRRWAEARDMRLVGRRKFYLGYANVMAFRKQGTPDGPGPRIIRLRCLSCGSDRMSEREGAVACAACGHRYRIEAGILRTLEPQDRPSGRPDARA